ncbi:hypothetical protein TBK1r_08120 [Stieleria magnilauensis]|uniref:Uncharacterized protein n=1 Tax=Stieleria magnilauensis TaxID=2527963 RepID=A0ABX5XJ49_9BACT|nr:hypothetical protein TBK1r_08120 [Planctomycetes bacterium TBK1r]
MVIATMRTVVARTGLDAPYASIVGFAFAGAFLLASLRGDWDQLGAACILLFPTLLAAAFVPVAIPFILVSVFEFGFVGAFIENRRRKKSPGAKKTRIT